MESRIQDCLRFPNMGRNVTVIISVGNVVKLSGDHLLTLFRLTGKYLKNLTPETLALGHKMAFSRKNKRDIIDSGYHR